MTEITLKLTEEELKLIDKYVELNDETRSVFDKIKYAYPQLRMTLEQEGDYAVVSYNDTTYYRLMGEDTFCWYIKKGVSANYLVPTLVMVTDGETERLLEGIYYNDIQVKKEKEQRLKESVRKCVRDSVKWCEENPDKNPLDYLQPKSPEEIEQSLRESFVKAQKSEEWKELQEKIDTPTDKLIEDLMKDPPEFLKFQLGKTLEQLIERWWCDVFAGVGSDWDMETAVQDLCDRIFLWIPKEQDSSGTQRMETEVAVEAHNELLRKIKSKIHNKK